MSESSTDRLVREKDFHNEAFSSNKREKTRKYYGTTYESKQFYRNKVHENSEGKRILEYGCGPGSQAFLLAQNGAEVDAIDISNVAIELAEKKAKKLGVDINFSVMNAENLSFKDNTFDIVCGSGILHHLEIISSYNEINRVLKPGGKGIFFEPLGHNPFINFYRKLTPSIRTDDEHPLLMEDIELAKERFDEVNVHYFHFISIVASFLPGSRLKASGASALNKLDNGFFKVFPFLKKYAWIVVFELQKISN